MGRTITLTSNNGFGWSFGDAGLLDVELRTDHGLGWTATESEIDASSVVTNGGQDVTNNGEIVTNGAQ